MCSEIVRLGVSVTGPVVYLHYFLVIFDMSLLFAAFTCMMRLSRAMCSALHEKVADFLCTSDSFICI